jgi:hypothetical protein
MKHSSLLYTDKNYATIGLQQEIIFCANKAFNVLSFVGCSGVPLFLATCWLAGVPPSEELLQTSPEATLELPEDHSPMSWPGRDFGIIRPLPKVKIKRLPVTVTDVQLNLMTANKGHNL